MQTRPTICKMSSYYARAIASLSLCCELPPCHAFLGRSTPLPTLPLPSLCHAFLGRSTPLPTRMARTYRCTDCPLNAGKTHYVPTTQRAAHRLEIATFEANEANEIPVPVAQSADEVPVAQSAESVDGAPDADAVANFFTGLVLTDDGPDVRGQQHSRLFSSRTDFQTSVPEVPLEFQPLPVSDALASIQAVANATRRRTALPPRQERRESDVREILERIRTAHATLDTVYE